MIKIQQIWFKLQILGLLSVKQYFKIINNHLITLIISKDCANFGKLLLKTIIKIFLKVFESSETILYICYIELPAKEQTI